LGAGLAGVAGTSVGAIVGASGITHVS
jgi:predicted acylesterase/phospholipase RssA